ncbi:GerMN domain-containing protein [Alteribacter aurantiacus]|uniref:GerMN domain-containing protein n=1 Tax=Alteribacter aurantiacus TaxID=254410 RepID=UPI0004085443|nr:GerMN domain-containing protein [Alteribacter aurantiacus]
MKRAKWLFVTLSATLVLAACGQGETDEDVSGTDGDSAEEVVEDDVEDGDEEESADDEAEDTEVEEATEEDDATEDEATEEEEEATEEDASTEDEATEEEAAEEEEVAVLNGVTYYYSDDQLMDTYRVSTSDSVTMDEAGAKEVVQTWINGPEKDGLMGLLPSNVSVQSVEFSDGVAHVSFSSNIKETNLGSSGELMFTEQLSLLMTQFGYDRTQLLIDGNVPNEFLGHMDVSEPFQAPSSAEYSEY